MVPRRNVSLEDYFSDNTAGRSEKKHSQSRRFDPPIGNPSVSPPAPNRGSGTGDQCDGGRRRSACGAIRSAITDAAIAFGEKTANMTGGLISVQDFNRALDRIIPPPVTRDGFMPINPLREAEFTRVAELLELVGKREWSRRPRTYTILRSIGCAEAIEDFITDRLSDFALPYTEENLPASVKGSRARSMFLGLQKHVLKPHAADLEQGGSHKHFSESGDEYFKSMKELGSGGFGQVDHVWSKLSLRDFARKRIPRGRSFKEDKVVIANFVQELTTFKLLSHQHLVKLVGSYTDSLWVGLIMDPVAEMNLAVYLTCQMDSKVRQICLRRFYGCLATAMAYLHKNKIRHKDVKPQNILVKGTDVYLTDFGTSLSWSDDTRSTTSGIVGAFTKRYCSPEVADQEVFSLR